MRRRDALWFLAGAGCARAIGAPAADLAPWGNGSARPHRRSVARGTRGMVASAHPAATLAGVEVLREGGTAVDAAIATNAVLTVVQPMMCGVGGDLFAQVWSAKEDKLLGLNASGRAPLGVSLDKIERTAEGGIPLDSPASWTVPGCVDGWFALHARLGRLPMARLLAPAIAAARDGVPVPRTIAAEWKPAGRAGFAGTFLPAPAEGDRFRNPAFADVLAAIAEGGRDVFYRGEIAARLARFSREQGGFLAAEDLARHRSDWVEPIATDYRGVRVHQIPPPGQGLAVLQMLNLLETFDLRALGRASPDFWHTLVEVKKLVFADRAAYYAEPPAMRVPVDALLAKAYARRRRAAIDPARAARQMNGGFEDGDTTYLAVGDAEGNLVSLIQSLYQACGSTHVPDGLGFCLQDRGAQFSLVPGAPNQLAPGKRPFHTIIPGFATRDGKPWLAFGVMGGDFQPQGHAQILVNLIDFGMDLQAAGDAPRFRHAGSREPAGAMTPMRDGGEVRLEPGLPAAVVRGLERRGHRVIVVPPDVLSSFGGYQAVALDVTTGHYAGATESRTDGVALGLS